MLNIKNITANLITTTVVVSGIAYFSLGITQAKDAVKSENHDSRGRGSIYSQKDATSVHPDTRASSQNTVTPVFLSTPSPYPDAWVTTEPSASNSKR